MARPLTLTELAYLRTSGQFSRIYLGIHKPATVFACRLASTPSSLDQVVLLPYNTVTIGSYTSVLAHQTCYVGSTAGAYDKGIVRVRPSLDTTPADATNIYIGETSDINFSSGDYLTVVDEFAPWPRHLRIDTSNNNTVYMDWDIVYSNQHDPSSGVKPTPIMGAPAVLWYDGVNPVTISFDASASYQMGGSITGFAWSAPGSASSTGMTTATPTITYNNTGQYRVDLTVTGSSGKTNTGHRYVFVYRKNVYDNSTYYLPARNIKIDSLRGDYQSGGWEFQITLYDPTDANIANIRDRVMVALFADDWYGDTKISIGPLAGREQTVCWGWIVGESIDWNFAAGSVSFTVKQANYWLNNMPGFPIGLQDTGFPGGIQGGAGGAPTAWTQFQNLTVDNWLWHFLTWRSTATVFTDCYLTGDTRYGAQISAPSGTLWQQLQVGTEQTILAHPCFDRYGRLFVEIEPNYIDPGNRSSFPVVMDITKADWHGSIKITRRQVPETAQVDLSGVVYNPAAPELVLNPGFESGFTSWNQFPNGGSIATDTRVHSGSLAAKLTSGAGLNTYIEQTITVTSSTAYIFNVWASGDGINSGQYYVFDVTNNTDIIFPTDTQATATTYALVQDTFTTASNTTSIKIGLKAPVVGSGLSAWFDDVSLKLGPTAIFSLSPGHSPKHYGRWDTVSNLMLLDQTSSNHLAGNILGAKNHPWPDIAIEFAQNNRAFDICPHQYGTLTMLSTDNIAGLSFTGLQLIPRKINLKFDPKAHTFLVGINFEGASPQENSSNGDAPPTYPLPPVSG